MIDISKEVLNVHCPKCKKEIKVSLKQIADEALIKCTCGQGIQLKDNDGSNRKAIYTLNKSLKDLENVFKTLG